MAPDHPHRRGALQLHRHNEIGVAQRQGFGPRQACDWRPGGEGDGDDRVLQTRTKGGDERQRQYQARKRDEDVGNAHEQAVHPAAEIAGHSADQQADRADDHGHQHHDVQRDTRAIHQPAEHIAAVFIGAEPVLFPGHAQGRRQILGERVMGGDPRREQGNNQQRHDDNQACQGHRVAQQKTHQANAAGSEGRKA
ncbi:hypothetical protein ALP75_204444 [Pseudomonas syringae pv. actinidiae]|nr:hypothetical protein ALP75_204444 [Pseudomonas syringae pv. actinidiae]